MTIILSIFICFIVPITCSTKILTLAIAAYLFILVGVICECAMVLGVYILLSPPIPEGTDVHILQHIHQKDLNLVCYYIIMGRLLLKWKKRKQGIQLCLWCLQSD